jgi:hypothetical protein
MTLMRAISTVKPAHSRAVSNFASALSQPLPEDEALLRKTRSVSRGTDEEEEEFFDALDVFDKDVIKMLNLDENFETLQSDSPKRLPP